MDKIINVGVIGCGHWGPNHVRNFSHLPGSKALMCSDLDEKRLKAMKDTFLNIVPTKDYRDILNSKDIDAVCIVTPTTTHYSIVKEALEKGKDVLCEKPLCVKPEEAEELIKIAEKNKRILMVGHVFIFNNGIQKMKEYLNFNDLGKVNYIHCERINLGPFRKDVDVVWDLASHDISITNYLLDSVPIEVTAKGMDFLQPKVDDVAFVSLTYPEKVLVNIHVSWLDPKKVRQITIVGEKKMVCWDDLDMVGPIKVYDKKVVREQYYESFGEFFLLAREGDITIPKVNLQEPLKAQDNHFLECVRERKQPLTDGKGGYDVVRVLKAVSQSLLKDGAPVKVK